MSCIKVKIFDGIGLIKIDKPETMNSLDSKILTEIDRTIKILNNEKRVKVLIITGTGNSFVSGADIQEMQYKDTIKAREFSQLGMDVFRKIELMNKPVIATVNGFALGGGCELALACDFIIAGDDAKFGYPEVSLGITPGFGGTQRFTRLVGINVAKEYIYTGRVFGAHKAKEIGLVNEVVPRENLFKRVVELAMEITRNSRTAIGYCKSAINRGIEADIETGFSIEMDMFGLCFATEDQIEGMSAFMNKRSPNFD